MLLYTSSRACFPKRVKEKEETKVNSPINLLIGAIVIVVLIIILLRLL